MSTVVLDARSWSSRSRTSEDDTADTSLASRPTVTRSVTSWSKTVTPSGKITDAFQETTNASRTYPTGYHQGEERSGRSNQGSPHGNQGWQPSQQLERQPLGQVTQDQSIDQEEGWIDPAAEVLTSYLARWVVRSHATDLTVDGLGCPNLYLIPSRSTLARVREALRFSVAWDDDSRSLCSRWNKLCKCRRI